MCNIVFNHLSVVAFFLFFCFYIKSVSHDVEQESQLTKRYVTSRTICMIFEACRNIKYSTTINTIHTHAYQQILGDGFEKLNGSNGEEILTKFYLCSISCVDNRSVGEGGCSSILLFEIGFLNEPGACKFL